MKDVICIAVITVGRAIGRVESGVRAGGTVDIFEGGPVITVVTEVVVVETASCGLILETVGNTTLVEVVPIVDEFLFSGEVEVEVEVGDSVDEPVALSGVSFKWLTFSRAGLVALRATDAMILFYLKTIKLY